MQNKIHQLSPLVANQIAAGEVVERPASVVKELLENSLDAESTRIEAEIVNGGRTLIRVTDNGTGIAKDDLVLALSRHATSKIVTVDDLAGVASLGFRGEALASIAAIANLTLTSAEVLSEQAWQISVDGEQQQPTLSAAAHPQGTTITVAELFANVPVRRKFLRADKTEFNHIEDVIKRLALNYFSVAFRFIHNEKEIFNLPVALTKVAQQQRIAKLCGKNFLSNSKEVQHHAEGLALTGWVSNADASRAYNDLQYFFINGRMVRDKLINHALRQAVENLIPEGRHLAYILYLQCDPTVVDVNVHPTKHEVRFQQSRLIHDFVYSAVRNVLQPKNFSMTEQTNINYDFHVQDSRNEYKVSKNLYGDLIGQVKNRYLLTETESKLFIIDLFKMRKLLLAKEIADNNIIAQPLLLPVTINLTAKNMLQLQQINLLDYAIEWQQITDEKIIVRAVPSYLREADIVSLFSHLLETTDIEKTLVEFVASIPQALSKQQQQAMLQQLETLPVHQVMQMIQEIPLELEYV